jgi:hypothetical protein
MTIAGSLDDQEPRGEGKGGGKITQESSPDGEH